MDHQAQIGSRAAREVQATIADRVAELLDDEIRRGVLGAGEPLRQNDVAARLGVSSTPVREAFRILERAGLVERVGRGVRVFRPSVNELVETYEVRAALESHAARLAAGRLSDQALASMRQIMDSLHRPDVTQDEFLRLDMEFHLAIAHGSGVARLASHVESEKVATTTFVSFLGVDWHNAEDASAEHAAILAALHRHDGDAAAAAMTAHLRNRAAVLRSRLDSVPANPATDGCAVA